MKKGTVVWGVLRSNESGRERERITPYSLSPSGTTSVTSYKLPPSFFREMPKHAKTPIRIDPPRHPISSCAMQSCFLMPAFLDCSNTKGLTNVVWRYVRDRETERNVRLISRGQLWGEDEKRLQRLCEAERARSRLMQNSAIAEL